MSTKTKLQLEMELKEAQATIAKLERDLQKARASGEEEQPTDKHPTKKPQREEDFLKLLEVLPVGVSILNHDRKVVFQNSALSQILDMTAEGIQAGAYKNRKYLASDGAAMPADGFASVQAEQSGQAVYNVETGIIQENGETIWTSVSAVPTDLPDWKTVIVTADVTERKLLEKRLFESEKRYTLLFEKSAVPSILFKLPEAVIVDVNEAGEKLTGFSKQEMYGKTAPELGLMKPQLRTEALSQFEKQGSLAGKEILIQAKSGEERIVISNTNPVTISGHPHAITTLLDITESKHAEKKLRENERIFNLFVEYSPAAIAMFDKDMHYLAASHRFAIDYGLPSYNIIGKSHYEVFPEIPERWKEIHRRCLAGAVEREEADPFPRADGSIDWVRWEIHPWYESEGKIGGIILFSEVITERIQLEQERAKLNERLDLATRSAGIGIWDWDIKKNEIVWDDQMYSLYGLNTGEFGGAYEAWLNGVYPEDQGPSNEVSAAAVRGEREYDTEFRVLWPDGSVHWLKANGQVFRDENGTPLRMIGVNYDITESKLLETQIQESERTYRELVQNANSAIIRWKNNGEISFFNEFAQSFFGYQKDEVTGKSVGILVPDSDSTGSDLSTLVQNIVENPDQFVNVVNENVCKDGRRVWMAWTNKPIYGEDGQVNEILAVGVDISERKRVENALQQSQENFAKAFSSNPAALAITRNSDGKFIIVNDSYTSIMGYSESEIIGRNVTELSIYIDPNERGQLLRTLAEEGRVVNYELAVLTKNRTQHVLLVSMEPILYDMESCILSTFIDITERKLIEEELRRSNAELEQFAYIASHDLQEPLRALSGMVQLLQKRYQGQLDERADEYIRHAVDAASRMQSLIQALLSYSRAQRNNQPIELVDAGTCLQIAIKNLDASVQESHAVITADALPHVHANPAQLIQLFQNLIGNGIKFRGDEEPQIHISVTELKDAWQFSIRDNGIGIEPQYFERIFMIFQRLHTQREYSGTGIGLALCKKIIDRYGGRIWVESEPHRGSIFHFTLPLRSNS
jgi:PAS domain S-box-containing protein